MCCGGGGGGSGRGDDGSSGRGGGGGGGIVLQCINDATTISEHVQVRQCVAASHPPPVLRPSQPARSGCCVHRVPGGKLANYRECDRGPVSSVQ